MEKSRVSLPGFSKEMPLSDDAQTYYSPFYNRQINKIVHHASLQTFYFKMVNQNSFANPCFTLAWQANDASQAKTIVESQYGGYIATPISYAQYIDTSGTCAGLCSTGYHWDGFMCVSD